MKELRLMGYVVQLCPVTQIPDSEYDAHKPFLKNFFHYLDRQFIHMIPFFFFLNSMSGYPGKSIPPTSDTPFSQAANVSGFFVIFVELQAYTSKYKCMCTPFFLLRR